MSNPTTTPPLEATTLPPSPQLIEAPPPPPPPPEHSAAQLRLNTRIWCAFVFLVSASMLAVGLYLTPSPTGTGSHQELGLPPCGFLAATGYPCLTCGCTTAVSNFSHGHFLRSFLTQPFGFVVALLAAILIPLTLLGLATGKWSGPSMFWLGWYWPRWVFGLLGILFAAWVYKIIIIRYGILF